MADLIREVGISEQTFYRRKKQYAGLESDQVCEFKQFSEENLSVGFPSATPTEFWPTPPG